MRCRISASYVFRSRLSPLALRIISRSFRCRSTFSLMCLIICCLEDADYEGHSLMMLRRIAVALNKRVEIRFMSTTNPKRPKTREVA